MLQGEERHRGDAEGDRAEHPPVGEVPRGGLGGEAEAAHPGKKATIPINRARRAVLVEREVVDDRGDDEHMSAARSTMPLVAGSGTRCVLHDGPAGGHLVCDLRSGPARTTASTTTPTSDAIVCTATDGVTRRVAQPRACGTIAARSSGPRNAADEKTAPKLSAIDALSAASATETGEFAGCHRVETLMVAFQTFGNERPATSTRGIGPVGMLDGRVVTRVTMRRPRSAAAASTTAVSAAPVTTTTPPSPARPRRAAVTASRRSGPSGSTTASRSSTDGSAFAPDPRIDSPALVTTSTGWCVRWRLAAIDATTSTACSKLSSS